MIRLGICLWNQASDWRTFEHAARSVEALGYDHLWTWDHLLACEGDPNQATFEPYVVLTAWAMLTSRVRLGLLTGANTFRSPGLVAKLAATIDQVSRGRMILGMGAGWFEREHRAYGIDFGRSVGERLDWLGESVALMRGLLDGSEVTSATGGRYAIDALRIVPGPVQARLPILIGGSGERKTLPIVARHADMWNVMGGDVEFLRRKDAVLRAQCELIGRDETEIERTVGCNPIIRDSERQARQAYELQMSHNHAPVTTIDGDDSFWLGTPDRIAEMMIERRAIGFSTFIAATAAPLDEETVERLIGEVKPLVESA